MKRAKPSAPKLRVQMVPATMWGKNVRAIVAQDVWGGLRWYFGAAPMRPQWLSIDFPMRLWTPPKCGVCKREENNLHLHELWSYDDKNKIQKLTGFQCLCENCHLAVHMGRARQLGLEEKAVEHLRAVNGWNYRDTICHLRDANEQWLKRSATVYTLDVKWLERYIPRSKIHLDWLDSPKRWVGDRLEAIQWARDILESDALILDTETTGLADYPRAEIIELAIINTRGRALYNRRFKPRYSIPARVIKVHGITNHAVSRCASFADCSRGVFEILAGRKLVTFNAKFDQTLLNQTCKLHGLTAPDCRWECAMQTYRTFEEVGRWLPLPGGNHSALDDAKATLKLIKRMARSM